MLYPNLLRNRITEITLRDLRELSVHVLFLDVDNTLTAHHSQTLSPEVAAWLGEMRRCGITLMVVSNAVRKRVEPFAQKIGLPFLSLAVKPLPFGFWRGMTALGAARDECAAVGDQTFTDVLGARLAGVKAIQLLPIEPEEGLSFRVRRALERPILRRFGEKYPEGKR